MRGDIEDGNLWTFPRVIEPHVNLKGSMSGRSETEVQLGGVALLRTFKGFQTLRILSQTAKAEIFESDNAPIGDACKRHGVVPHVEVVLQPLLVGHKTGNTRRIILISWQTENLETFAGHLRYGFWAFAVPTANSVNS